MLCQPSAVPATAAASGQDSWSDGSRHGKSAGACMHSSSGGGYNITSGAGWLS